MLRMNEAPAIEGYIIQHGGAYSITSSARASSLSGTCR
jgi:hypothetical protein